METAQTQSRPNTPPPEFQAGEILKMDSAQLVAILKDPSATEFRKMKACQRLAVAGTADAIPVLAAMLSDPKLAHYARTGLIPIPDPAVDDALRAAAGKLKGRLLVGVVNSIGQRADVKAVPMLTRMLYGADAEAGCAAAASLARIGGPSSVKALQEAANKGKGAVKTAALECLLVAAEGLMAQGDRKGALAVYTVLSRPEMPKPVRLAAMHSIIAVETAIDRPKPAAPGPGGS
jgi:HEAT repeat protein